MDYKEYLEELKLIQNQNNVEQDLYNLIIRLLKQIEPLNNYSIRDVSGRRRTQSENEKPYWGINGFPDIVILDKKDNNKIMIPNSISDVHAVIEAKAIGESLDKYNNKVQVVGHILSFGNVIHTNGYEWRIYKLSNNDRRDDLRKELIGKLSDKTIQNIEEYTYSLREKSKDIKKTWNKIRNSLYEIYNDISMDYEITLTDSDSTGWKELTNKLKTFPK